MQTNPAVEQNKIS